MSAHAVLWVTWIVLAGCAPSGTWLDVATPSDWGPLPPEAITTLEEGGAPRVAPEQVRELGDDGATVVLGGVLDGPGDYELHAFGPSRVGDRWTIERGLFFHSGAAAVALFDENTNLLARARKAGDYPLTYVMHRDSAVVYVGAGLPSASGAHTYHVRVSRTAGVAIALPQSQVVWLNFGGITNLELAGWRGLSFGPFTGEQAGPAYADDAGEIRAQIVRTMQRVYGGYAVTVISSDESPEPTEPHAAIHFGGWDERYVGWADSVDTDNADPGQAGVVLVESFARYAPMALDPVALGTMIGNVASHELGHLLGLYHTFAADSVMDISAGSAWDLSSERNLAPAPLDPEVFPVGRLDIPQVLADNVGRREPRAIKRRRKSFPYLVHPRHRAQKTAHYDKR